MTTANSLEDHLALFIEKVTVTSSGARQTVGYWTGPNIGSQDAPLPLAELDDLHVRILEMRFLGARIRVFIPQ